MTTTVKAVTVTKRCKYCGKVMTEVTLPDDQTVVLQCPRCKYTEPLPVPQQ